jgi:DNA-binding NarL/FixJ family response regulator
MDDAGYAIGTSADRLGRHFDHMKRTGATAEEELRSILILSDIRFLREGLAEVLQRDAAFSAVGLAADLDEALAVVADRVPQIILVDVSLPDGLAAVPRLRNLAPQPQIVALALMETETAVMAWAEAGVSGYVPRNTGLSELIPVLEGIVRGEQTCSRKITASLLRRVSQSPRQVALQAFATAQSSLTVREQQVMQLIGTGLSNKEIARRLNIGVGTTKSHVHHVLCKLALNRRSQIARWMNSPPVSPDVLWDLAPKVQEQLSVNRRATPRPPSITSMP